MLLLLPLILADSEGDEGMGGGVSCKSAGHPTGCHLGLTVCVMSDRDIPFPGTLLLFTSGLI